MNNPEEILLVEDNPADVDLVRLRLKETNAHVNIFNVNRLADALSKIEQKPPHVILLDLNLPDSRGAETF
jgi:DNA-binding response OmpR family regulator